MVDKIMWLVCGSPTMQRGAAWSMQRSWVKDDISDVDQPLRHRQRPVPVAAAFSRQLLTTSWSSSPSVEQGQSPSLSTTLAYNTNRVM